MDSRSELSCDETMRYSRQLILPEVSVSGQVRLKKSSVLIVGAGGLGCPAAVYLAAAGVGRIGVADHDTIDLSNLHRQVLHTTARVDLPKVFSIAESIKSLNSCVDVETHYQLVSSETAVQLVGRYDVVLDCTDNVATRYLLSDACVLAGKPLVSAAALRFEGQLTTYNYEGSPCYRCLFPTAPPPSAVTNCSDGGVLGVVPGIIGSLQAMEVLRILLPSLSARHAGSMLLYNAVTSQFRSVQLRQKQRDCAVCGEQPTITVPIDYKQFCGAGPTDKDVDISLLCEEERLTPAEFSSLPLSLLVDVRPEHELSICRPHFPRVLHMPLHRLQEREEQGAALVQDTVKRLMQEHTGVACSEQGEMCTVATLCRRGNDSQRAALLLKRHLVGNSAIIVRDIRGGLYAWKEQLESDLPLY